MRPAEYRLGSAVNELSGTVRFEKKIEFATGKVCARKGRARTDRRDGNRYWRKPAESAPRQSAFGMESDKESATAPHPRGMSR